MVSRPSARQLGAYALALCAMVIAIDLLAPCSLSRWINFGLSIAFIFYALAVVGTAESRPEISDTARGVVMFLALAGLLGASGVAFMAHC